MFSIPSVSRTWPPTLRPTIATESPFLAEYIAAETAAGPAPITVTSYSLFSSIFTNFPSSRTPKFKLKSIFPPNI